MDDILNDFSVRALTTAIETKLQKYYQYLSQSNRVELYENPKLTRFFSGIPHPFMNVIFCKHLTSFDTIEETVNLSKSRKLPFLCWIGSAAKSADWGTKLHGCGLLAYDQDYACMAADLLSLNDEIIPPTNLTIKPVSDKETLNHWVNSALIGFGLPINSDNVCFDLFIGLGFDAPLQEAPAMGYGISVLHPSDMGRGVYRRIGFNDYGKLSHGLWVEKT